MADPERRMIIGESEQAGIPISAPIHDNNKPFIPTMRWRRDSNSFVLEQWREHALEWVEIPCVELPGS